MENIKKIQQGAWSIIVRQIICDCPNFGSAYMSKFFLI